MKIRSKNLWQYLSDTGALKGSESDIAKGKEEYRRMYFRQWKELHKRPQKELRIILTIREYLDLKVKALEVGLKPTPYLKELALVAIATKQRVDKNSLKKILQLVKMASTSNSKDYKNLLMEAEKLLLDFM